MCVGDCDGSGDVTVNELIIMVNIALANAPLAYCVAGDADHSGEITINEIIAAVTNALNGCGGWFSLPALALLAGRLGYA